MRDSESAPDVSHTTEAFGRALHAIAPSSAIPTLADNDFIRDAQQQEKTSERTEARIIDHHNDDSGASAAACASTAGAVDDHHDNDSGEAEGITTSHPRLAVPSQAQIGGSAVVRCSGGAATPITREQREADAARARSVLPYAAQVMWGVAL